MKELTIRDYFATNALTGLTICGIEVSIYIRSSMAYNIADAMLEVRKKKDKNLTIRDIIASQAQLGLCAYDVLYSDNAMALKAYEIADAMLKSK